MICLAEEYYGWDTANILCDSIRSWPLACPGGALFIPCFNIDHLRPEYFPALKVAVMTTESLLLFVCLRSKIYASCLGSAQGIFSWKRRLYEGKDMFRLVQTMGPFPKLAYAEQPCEVKKKKVSKCPLPIQENVVLWVTRITTALTIFFSQCRSPIKDFRKKLDEKKVFWNNLIYMYYLIFHRR